MEPIANQNPPVVLGIPGVGEELAATFGVWDHIPTSYVCQWQRATDTGGTGLTNIGTDSKTFTPSSSESGKYIRVVVTASNGCSSLSVASSYVGPVAASVTAISIDTLGCKTLTAVGTITGGTGSLVLTSNPGFQVGDQIIVAVGGEAGGGLRGTKGVGGYCWPLTTYATTADLLAASPAEFTKAAAEDTGHVYFRGASSWTDLTDTPNLYYSNMTIPKALVATITGISGTGNKTLALNTTAAVTATNANVYFDNRPLIEAAWTFNGTHTDPNLKWAIPAGTYALSGGVNCIARTGWVISGVSNTQSKFISPDGSPCIGLAFSQCVHMLIRDYGVVGNNGANGFGVPVPLTPIEEMSFPNGNWFSSCDPSMGLRLRGDDCFQKYVGADFGFDIWSHDCAAYHSEGNQAYIQWDFQNANVLGGGIVDCSSDSPNLVGGAELFQGSRGSIIRYTSRNATMSLNTTDSFFFDDMTIAIENNSILNSASFSAANPIINVNANIGDTSGTGLLSEFGGIIRVGSIVQTGRADGNKTSLMGIVIGSAYNNVRITGTYPDGITPKGLISCPVYESGDSIGGFSGMGVRSSGARTTVTGLRFVGGPDFASGKGNVHTEGGSMFVQHCVMDHAATGSASPLTESGTQSNATWLATH